MLTADTLFQQYESSWSTLSPRRRAAFRGNLTWLLSRTTDLGERDLLLALQERTQPNAAAAHAALAPRPAPRTFSVSATTLQLRRRTLRLAETEATGVGLCVSRPHAAAAVASQLIGDQPQEHLLLLLLDRQNQITGVHTVHIGTTGECMAAPADILRVALLANAASLILSHNHPSGNPTPSDADLESTRRIVAACQLLDVRVLDHVIVTDDASRYTSLAERDNDLFTHRYQWQ